MIKNSSLCLPSYIKRRIEREHYRVPSQRSLLTAKALKNNAYWTGAQQAFSHSFCNSKNNSASDSNEIKKKKNNTRIDCNETHKVTLCPSKLKPNINLNGKIHSFLYKDHWGNSNVKLTLRYNQHGNLSAAINRAIHHWKGRACNFHSGALTGPVWVLR